MRPHVLLVVSSIVDSHTSLKSLHLPPFPKLGTWSDGGTTSIEDKVPCYFGEAKTLVRFLLQVGPSSLPGDSGVRGRFLQLRTLVNVGDDVIPK